MAVGNTQVIGGKSYTMYSPEWRAAQDANQIHTGTVAGQAAGAGEGAGIRSEFASQFPGWQPPNPGAAQYGGTGTVHNGFSPAANASLQGLIDSASRTFNSVDSTGNSRGLNTSIPTQASVTGPSGAVEDAARAATFARTKDNAAHTEQASLNGLSEALGARGLQGGGYEAGQIGGTLAREANTIGEGDRQEAESELQSSQHRADEQFQGEVTQRGQDLAARNANNNLAMEARQQDLQKRQMSLTALTSALSLSKGAY